MKYNFDYTHMNNTKNLPRQLKFIMRLKSHKIIILSAITISASDLNVTAGYTALSAVGKLHLRHMICFLVTFHLFFGEVMVSFFFWAVKSQNKVLPVSYPQRTNNYLGAL